MSDLDQIADQAAKKMAEGLLTQDTKVRNYMNRTHEHYVVFNKALLETINVTASMTELVQIIPDFFNKFADERDKRAVELESRGVKMVDNPPTSAGVVQRGMTPDIGQILSGTTDTGYEENILGSTGGTIRDKRRGSKKPIFNSYNRLRQKMNNLSEDLRSFSIKGVRKGKDLGHQNVTAVSQRMTAVLVNLIDLKAAIIQANPDVKSCLLYTSDAADDS